MTKALHPRLPSGEGADAPGYHEGEATVLVRSRAADVEEVIR